MTAPKPARPSIDVVVPFKGSRDALRRVVQRVQSLELADGDTVTVVDNTPGSSSSPSAPGVRVVAAPDRQSSYFARNAGAADGAGEWLLFLDGDVDPPPDLIERYFRRPPHERSAVLAGAVIEVPDSDSLASHYTAVVQLISPEHHTLPLDEFGYAVTANCAIRRSAFEAIGGFTDTIRSGGDADICFRLKRADWKIETRHEAQVVHRGRTTVRGLLRQTAKHGTGIEWLAKRYPGFAQRRSVRALGVQTARHLLQAARGLRSGNRDDLAVGLMGSLHLWATWAGRWLPNEVNDTRRVEVGGPPAGDR